MCGRFTLTVPTYEELAEALGVEPTPGASEAYRPRYNLPPTDPAWIVRVYHGVKELVSSSWGLVPRWSKSREQGGRPINARSESAGGRSLFRDSLARRRCIVVADGFFEWEKAGKERRPYWFRPANGDLLLMAGVWDHWFDIAAEKKVCTFSILTTNASADVEPLHDRMPVIISRADMPTWLAVPDSPDAAEVTSDIRALLRPSDPGTLSKVRVSNRVNSVKNDDARCIAPPSDEELARAAAPPERAVSKPKAPRGKKPGSDDSALSLFEDLAPKRSR